MPLEESFGFRAGDEHQHEQPELVEKIEGGFLGRHRNIELQKMYERRYAPEDKRSQQDAGQNFANHPRLAHAGEEITQRMSSDQQNGQKENKRSNSRRWHGLPGSGQTGHFDPALVSQRWY